MWWVVLMLVVVVCVEGLCCMLFMFMIYIYGNLVIVGLMLCGMFKLYIINGWVVLLWWVVVSV